MSIRNIVKIGGSYYVALPKKWVKEYNIDKTRMLNLEFREDGVLEITPLETKYHEQKVKRIIVSPLLKRNIVAAYLRGFEVIEIDIKGHDVERVVSMIEDLQKILIGMEIVEETKRKVVLQCFTTSDYNLESLLYRMDSISRSMYTDAVKAFEDGNVNLAESVRRRDDNLDRIYFLTVRTIRSKMVNPLISGEERLVLLDYRLLARDLEEIGDLGEEIASNTSIERHNCGLQHFVQEIATYQKDIVKNIIKDETQGYNMNYFERIKLLSNTLDRLVAKEECRSIMSSLGNILYKLKDIQDLA